MSSTPPNPGTRTPRRVQWASSDHVHSPPSEPASPHALDEMAKDPNAFETLKDALERHRSSSQSGSPHPTAVTQPQVPTRTHPSTNNNMQPSTIHPPDGISMSNPPPLRHSYPPSSPSSSAPTSPTSSAPFLPHRTYAVPGEAFIDPLESAGLPLSSRQASGDSEMTGDGHAGRVEHLAVREAAGVVRAHTKRWGMLRRRRHRSKSRVAPDQETEKTHTHRLKSSRSGRDADTEYESEASEFDHPYLTRRQTDYKDKPKKSWWQFHTPPSVAHPPHDTEPYDVESHPLHNSQPKLGTGVLSALLALYGQDHEQGESGTWSARASEDEGDLSGPDQPWIESGGRSKKSKSLGRTLHSASASASSLIAAIPSVPPAFIPPALKPKEKAPATTAALVAGAGALVGAVVPKQTGLAPDLKRGYGLVRYKFEDSVDFALDPSTNASETPPAPPPTASRRSGHIAHATALAPPSPDKEYRFRFYACGRGTGGGGPRRGGCSQRTCSRGLGWVRHTWRHNGSFFVIAC
ncbi:hypothetical protein M405DRAFT_840658 [Rhizopogon salebrosus TDB-379]|nr:hypothetical protein M405DRAFT_840658 [Rhizopogon salebrosus TDB-379]